MGVFIHCRECSSQYAPGSHACPVCEQDRLCFQCFFKHFGREHPTVFVLTMGPLLGRYVVIAATLWRVWVTL